MRAFLAALLLCLVVPAQARDNGQFAQNPLKPWFDSLKSRKGFCCSDADGRPTDYDMKDAAYWVPINGVMTRVPDDAVITEPNKIGHAMLWLTYDQKIRCFIPGAGL